MLPVVKEIGVDFRENNLISLIPRAFAKQKTILLSYFNSRKHEKYTSWRARLSHTRKENTI